MELVEIELFEWESTHEKNVDRWCRGGISPQMTPLPDSEDLEVIREDFPKTHQEENHEFTGQRSVQVVRI